jgi:hypothetical protein
VSSEKNGQPVIAVGHRESLTSRFEPSEGVLAFLSELAAVKEPRFRLFDGGLDLGVAVNAEVTVRDEIRNNNSIRGGGSVCGGFCNRDRNGCGLGDLDGDWYLSLGAGTSGRPKPMEDSRDAVLESPGHRSYPRWPGGGGFSAAISDGTARNQDSVKMGRRRRVVDPRPE